jgi:uncharacterized membrane protein YGL010W
MDAVKTLNYSVFVRSIEEQMSIYAAYHHDARNRATHFVGVPAIILSLFIPLAWIRFESGGVTITASMLFAGAVVLYYFFLDVPLALAMVAVTGLLVWAGHRIAELGTMQGWIWFALLFIGGWILQLIGHAFEGRRPALADNLFQIFVAPIFLAAEAFFALGYKPELQRRINAKAQLSRAQSAESSSIRTRTSSKSGASGSRSR